MNEEKNTSTIKAMERTVNAMLANEDAIKVGPFYVVEMHTSGDPDQWWILNELYEFAKGTRSFEKRQSAIDQAVFYVVNRIHFGNKAGN